MNSKKGYSIANPGIIFAIKSYLAKDSLKPLTSTNLRKEKIRKGKKNISILDIEIKLSSIERLLKTEKIIDGHLKNITGTLNKFHDKKENNE